MSNFEKQLKPIKLALGTTVDEKTAPNNVYGRDGLVNDFWEDLKASSLSLIGERRSGKTWVMRLAQAKQPNWAETIWFDSEGIQSATDFVRRLNGAIFKGPLARNIIKRPFNWLRRSALGVEEIKGNVEFKNPDQWSSLLQATIKDLIKHSKAKTTVLMIDELPLCLDSISSERGASEATKLLDELRQLRMDRPSLRMVFCGSLGLHIVLKKFKEEGYTGRPTNDLQPFDVPPLDAATAQTFAGGLILGENISCTDIEAVSLAVAEVGSGVPYYIQHIIKYMKSNRATYSPKDVGAIPVNIFETTGDPADMRSHDERLDKYYPEDIVIKVRAALDVLSLEPDGLDIDRLLNMMKHNPGVGLISREGLQGVLQILQDDHYIDKSDGVWKFKIEIIRRWWESTRGRIDS